MSVFAPGKVVVTGNVAIISTDAEAAQRALLDVPHRFYVLPGTLNVDGEVEDFTENERHFTVAGAPTLGVTAGDAPFIRLNGTTDYFTIPQTAWNSFTGAFTFFLAYRKAATFGTAVLAGSNGGSGARRWYVTMNATAANPTFNLSGDGTSNVTAAITGTALDTWYVLAARYIPSTEVKLWLTGSAAVANTTSIPAAMFNATAALTYGANAAGSSLFSNCDYGLSMLVPVALADAQIEAIKTTMEAVYYS